MQSLLIMVKKRMDLLHRDDLPAFQLANNKGGTISQYIRQGEKLACTSKAR